MNCQICNKEVKNNIGLSGHIRWSHDISIRDYYDKFLLGDKSNKCSCGNDLVFNGIGGYAKHCSPRCSTLDSDTQRKMKSSYFEKTGYEYPNQNPEVKNKKIKTNLKNRNCEYPIQCPDIKKKIETTNLLNTGYRNPMQVKETREKAEITHFERTGYINPMQVKETREKAENTNFEKTGYKNCSQDPEIKEQKRLSFQEHYDVDCSFQAPEVQAKTIKTNNNKYGFDNYSQTPEGRRISRVTAIKHRDLQRLNNEPDSPRVGTIERSCLNELQSKFSNHVIIRQDSCFRGTAGRTPDGHIKELKLVILFDEWWHYLDKKKCTLMTPNSILEINDYENIGLKVFVISEYQWLNNKDQVISDFKSLIESLESSVPT